MFLLEANYIIVCNQTQILIYGRSSMHVYEKATGIQDLLQALTFLVRCKF